MPFRPQSPLPRDVQTIQRTTRVVWKLDDRHERSLAPLLATPKPGVELLLCDAEVGDLFHHRLVPETLSRVAVDDHELALPIPTLEPRGPFAFEVGAEAQEEVDDLPVLQIRQ